MYLHIAASARIEILYYSLKRGTNDWRIILSLISRVSFTRYYNNIIYSVITISGNMPQMTLY